jgi:hypothetical protein
LTVPLRAWVRQTGRSRGLGDSRREFAEGSAVLTMLLKRPQRNRMLAAGPGVQFRGRQHVKAPLIDFEWVDCPFIRVAKKSKHVYVSLTS